MKLSRSHVLKASNIVLMSNQILKSTRHSERLLALVEIGGSVGGCLFLSLSHVCVPSLLNYVITCVPIMYSIDLKNKNYTCIIWRKSNIIDVNNQTACNTSSVFSLVQSTKKVHYLILKLWKLMPRDNSGLKTKKFWAQTYYMHYIWHSCFNKYILWSNTVYVWKEIIQWLNCMISWNIFSGDVIGLDIYIYLLVGITIFSLQEYAFRCLFFAPSLPLTKTCKICKDKIDAAVIQ